MKRLTALLTAVILLCLTACADTTVDPALKLPSSSQTSATTQTTIQTQPPCEEEEIIPQEEQTPEYVKASLMHYMSTGESIRMDQIMRVSKFSVTQELIDILKIDQWFLSGLTYDQHEDIEGLPREDDPNAWLSYDMEIDLGQPEGKEYRIVLHISSTYIAIGASRPVQIPTEDGYISTSQTDYVCYAVPQEQDGEIFIAVYEWILENRTWFAS